MIKARNPFFAALFAFIPGLGQLYNGQFRKSMLLLLIDFIIIFFFYHTQIFMSIVSLSILIILSIGLILFRIIDAFIVAKKNKSYELKIYNKWYIYVLFTFMIVVSHLIIEETATKGIRSFSIPTGSMEPTIIVGDRIISQLGYYTNHDMNRNDLIVFHFPGEADKQIDEKTHYVSRCIAIPGDSLSIINKLVYINSKPANISADLKFKFKCFTSNTLSDRARKKYNIHSYDIYLNDLIRYENNSMYLIDLSQSTADKLKNAKIFDSIVELDFNEFDPTSILFPFAKKTSHWTADDFGPLWIPKKGSTIFLDENTIEIYGQTILAYEGNRSVEFDKDKLIINGNPVSEYTFKQNYYFTMGDSRHNSADGRMWGFVPEDHIVGKVWLLLYSKDNTLPFYNCYRTDRFFIPIK